MFIVSRLYSPTESHENQYYQLANGSKKYSDAKKMMTFRYPTLFAKQDRENLHTDQCKPFIKLQHSLL